jgi:hypothetical protein
MNRHALDALDAVVGVVVAAAPVAAIWWWLYLDDQDRGSMIEHVRDAARQHLGITDREALRQWLASPAAAWARHRRADMIAQEWTAPATDEVR